MCGYFVCSAFINSYVSVNGLGYLGYRRAPKSQASDLCVDG